jgi:Ankyrin repeats (3 copies)
VIACGVSEVILSLVNAGIEAETLNAVDSKDGFSALMFASAGGHVDIVRTLLSVDPQPDLNIASRFGATALTLAAKAGHEEVLQLLLEAGAKFNAHRAVNSAWDPLFWVVRGGHAGCLKLLLECKQPEVQDAVSYRKPSGHTALGFCVIDARMVDPDRTECLRVFLDAHKAGVITLADWDLEGVIFEAREHGYSNYIKMITQTLNLGDSVNTGAGAKGYRDTGPNTN